MHVERFPFNWSGAQPGEAAYVGDLYSVDVLGARAAGIHPVLLDPHGDWGEVDCLTVSSLAELVTAFKNRF